jgi:S-adenosylmethionine hydrolase
MGKESPVFSYHPSPITIFMFITLLTDFGTGDYFVGAMKGVILSVNPEARIFDISHEIPPQDVRAGAFTLAGAYQTFPAATVHVAVVDPGVGSDRRAILVSAGGHLFVGPDNGLFTHVYEREPDLRVFHLTNSSYFRRSVSPTFHGRDVFAPVAAALSKGVRAEELGSEITDYVRMPHLSPLLQAGKITEASIIHIDRFGNCVTNLTSEHLTEKMFAAGASLEINGHKVTAFRHYYGEAVRAPGGLFATLGSAGYIEIAAERESAASLLGAERGQPVRVLWERENGE